MSARYRAAIIGCGRVSRGHAAAYAQDPRVELVACADISGEASGCLGDEFAIPGRYLDYREMLLEERPEVVSVCTHHHLHAPMTIDVARTAAPRAILCEKPIALDLGEADAMIEACRAAGTMLLVGHQRRFSPQYIAAREALAGGRIGEVVSVEAFGHPGASLLVDSTHTIDLVRSFIGDPAGEWVIGQIDARQHRQAWGQPVEDCAVAWIRFQNGVHVLLGVGSVPPAVPDEPREPINPTVDGKTYHRIIVHGTKGRLEVDGDALSGDRAPVRIHRGAEVEEVFVVDPEEAGKRPSAVAREVSSLVDCLEDPGLRHPLNAESARATLEALLAVYESSRRRQAVRLPLDVEDNPLISMLNEGTL
jgi:predicted dehydrogenase